MFNYEIQNQKSKLCSTNLSNEFFFQDNFQHRKDASGRWVGPPIPNKFSPKPKSDGKSFVIESSRVGQKLHGKLGVKEYSSTGKVVDANFVEESYQITQKISPREKARKSEGTRARGSPPRFAQHMHEGPVVQSPKMFEIELQPPGSRQQRNMVTEREQEAAMRSSHGGSVSQTSSPARTRMDGFNRKKVPPLNVTSSSEVKEGEITTLDALRAYVKSPSGKSSSPMHTTYEKKAPLVYVKGTYGRILILTSVILSCGQECERVKTKTCTFHHSILR